MGQDGAHTMKTCGTRTGVCLPLLCRHRPDALLVGGEGVEESGVNRRWRPKIRNAEPGGQQRRLLRLAFDALGTRTRRLAPGNFDIALLASTDILSSSVQLQREIMVAYPLLPPIALLAGCRSLASSTV